ncbi:MAG: YhcB family protein [Colwellia sp.]|nr:YhcB family protein [Colwellia sp.]
MTILSGLLIFIIGAVAGFIVNKFFSASSQNQQKLAEKVNHSETALEQYKLDVAEHLDSSAKLLEQMNSTCKIAMEQMAQSTKLLQQATPEESVAMPFFSKETQEQLAQTVNLRHNKEDKKEEEQVTEAPLDYSGNPSGLFDDKKQSVTNTETSS